MAKKIFIVGFAMIILCLCCGVCFAEESNSVNLGNEIMESIDKTGESMNNVVSGNWIDETGNNVRQAGDNVGNDFTGTTNAGAYNTARTTVEGTTNTAGTMSTTTWMWIILVVAAIIIIAAIWYYATQNND